MIEYYETSDHYLAGLLFLFKRDSYKQYRIEQQANFKKIYFQFENKTECEEVIESYLSFNLKGNLHEYVDCLYKIKDIYKSIK